MSEEIVNTGQPQDFDVSVPDIPMPDTQEVPEIKDTFDSGFKFAFIGSGQGGGRIAHAFYKLGYRRVCAVNTAEQDLATLPLPAKMCLGTSGGAGKNPGVAKATFKDHKEDVLDFMRRSFGPSLDRIFVCVGAGGGTGAGTAVHLVDTAVELQKALKTQSQKVGVIVALPKAAEGKRPAANSFNTLNDLLDLTAKGMISPLIIVDNEKIGKLYPSLAVDPFWDTANASVASLFHLFNTICIQHSHYTSFDRADLLTVLDSGLITFGATPVRVDKGADKISDDINYAIRNGLKRNILTGGVDIGTGTVAASVVIGDSTLLAVLPQAVVEQAFDQLNRVLKAGNTVHRGIYRGNKPGMVVYTIIGGLGRPEEKLAELKQLGDLI
jgi:cell division GTPase FtsZ